MSSTSLGIQRFLRRPRLIGSALLAAGLIVVLLPVMPASRAMLVGFDIGAAVFLTLMGFMMFRATPQTMHRRAQFHEKGKWTVLVMSLCVAGVVLVSLSQELHAAKDKSLGDIALASGSIFLSWLFVAVMFSQQYAHSYYMKPGQFTFPGTDQPDYLDFMYFAVVLSMCCQTSDVTVTSSAMRRLVMVHSLVSFFFNVIIIAITVNVVAGVV